MRQLLATARWRVLPGVSIVFSGVFPKTPRSGDRWHALAIRVRPSTRKQLADLQGSHMLCGIFTKKTSSPSTGLYAPIWLLATWLPL